MAVTPKVVVDALGEGGVNVDDNPLRGDDNQTTKSQNATYDATRKRRGALCSRPGLARFNTVALDGPILGGIEAPYKGTASAPTSGGGGGGFPGDSGGTGQAGQGEGVGPGDSVGDGSAGGGGAIQGGAILTDNKRLFGGKRLVLIGRTQNTAATHGWYLASEGWADTAYKLNSSSNTTAGPVGPSVEPGISSGVITAGQPAYTLANGVLYYSQYEHSLAASASPTLPTLRKMSVDGNTDVPILTIPDNRQVLLLNGTPPNHRSAILAMCTEWGNGDAIYITVYDEVTNGTDAGDYGRILRVSGLDSGAYHIEEVFNTLTTTDSTINDTPCVPICVENFLGIPHFGLWRGVNTVDASVFAVRRDGVGPSGWGVYRLTTNVTASESDVTCMKAYKGRLYVGMKAVDPSVAFAHVYSHGPDVTAAVIDELTGSGGSVITGNKFVSMVVFQDNLYVSFQNPTGAGSTAKIYKYDGTTWSTAKTFTTAAQTTAYNLATDGDYIYAFGGAAIDTGQYFWSSPDGATWTDQRAQFLNTSANGLDFSVSSPVNVLFGIDQ